MSEVLLGAGDDADIGQGGVTVQQGVQRLVGPDTQSAVETGLVSRVAAHKLRHVATWRNTHWARLWLEVVMTHCPGEHRVTWHDQIVDGQRYEGAVVGGDTGSAQYLTIAHPTQGWHHVPHPHTPTRTELTHGKLKEIQRSPN